MKRIIITLCICTAWVASTYAQYPYTLKKCLEEGLANNYSIRITRNEEQISHNNATLANAGYLPTVDLSAGYTGTLDNTDTKSRSTGTTASERNIYDQTLKAGLDVNWTLFDGFNISTTYKKLKELERQGETNTRITLEDFIAGLTAEYYNYVQQEIRLKNFLYAVSLSKERLRIVEERYHIGNFSRLDYQQAKVDFNAGYTFNKYDINANSRRGDLGFNAGITVGFNIFDGNRRRESAMQVWPSRIAAWNDKNLELALRSDLAICGKPIATIFSC